MIIEAHDLRKTFVAKQGRGKKEKVEAVRGIDLEAEAGEAFPVPGPTGGEKPPTVGIPPTSPAPTSGTAYVAGYNVAKEPARVREKIGYVSQAGGIDENAP